MAVDIDPGLLWTMVLQHSRVSFRFQWTTFVGDCTRPFPEVATDSAKCSEGRGVIDGVVDAGRQIEHRGIA
jgi:hypothetical protein